MTRQNLGVPDTVAGCQPFHFLTQAADTMHQLSILLANLHLKAASHLFLHFLGIAKKLQ